ncbi:MAG TPA: potassium channel family protein [Flavisolibacter sp.]
MTQNIQGERRKLLHQVEKLLDLPMIFLGFVWLVLIIMELLYGLPPALEYVSLFIWGLFVLNFLLEFFLAPAKMQYLQMHWLTAISLLVPALRLFRLVRVLRLLRGARLIRVVSSLNRSMKSLGAAMKRRGVAYVIVLVIVLTLGGAAGMYAIEKGNPGFDSYGMSLWWTAMRIITAGSDFWPVTTEGRILAFILAVFGYAVFGYVTATLASYFIGRDAEEATAPVAGSAEITELKKMLSTLSGQIRQINERQQTGNDGRDLSDP